MGFYSLKNMRLLWCQSNSDKEFGKIRSIIVQEPENDPKQQLGVWQCSQMDNYIQLELYGLDFRRRDVLKKLKNSRKKRETFYSDLASVVSRFSFARKGT